jgi:aryl-alcohol dehydrogenase-like predicted oxidoreductase
LSPGPYGGEQMALDRYLSPRPEGQPAALVCGTMNFGKRTSVAESERIIARALEHGIEFFDTANAYNNGESERIVGKALRGKKARIATKCGIGPDLKKAEGLAKATVLRACEESLGRLGVERIDLYYLHKPDPATPPSDTLEALVRLREQGKIDRWAVSNFASWQIGDLQQLCDARGFQRPATSQVVYNLLIRQLDLEYFRFARAHQIHTTVYNPLAGGLLAGKGLPGQKLEQGSRFESNPMYRSRYLSQRFFELVEAYAALAASAGITLVDLSYAWIASRPGVDSVLLGPATVEQLDAAVRGCARPLPEGLAAKIDDLYRAFLGTDLSYAR